MMNIINPATGDTITTVQADTATSIATKVTQLKAGQIAWAKRELNQRIDCIRQFNQHLKKHKQTLAKDLSCEMGKPLSEANNEIDGACTRIAYFITHAEAILKPEIFHANSDTLEMLTYEPLGVIVNLSAWNYPYLVGVNVFIPALICGNAVAYKPSKFAILSGKNMENLLHESGVPSDVFSTIIGDQEAGQALLEIDFDGYYLTGGQATGLHVMRQVAEKLTPIGLELGGNDPFYVSHNNQHIDKVAASLVSGVFYNNGQSCCSVERIYVHRAIFAEFVEAFVRHTKDLVVGSPLAPTTTNGAITRAEQLDFLQAQVDDAVSKGAKVLTGGHAIESQGNFFAPTVLINVNHNMRIMTEESFGPIIGIGQVKSRAEAVALMNDSDYGLTAGIYTDDDKEAKDVMAQLNAGNVYHNCCDRVSPYLPWAGRKKSGLGASLSKHGVYAFSQTKGWHCRRA